jgi:hypothetical protein
MMIIEQKRRKPSLRTHEMRVAISFKPFKSLYLNDFQERLPRFARNDDFLFLYSHHN